VFFALWLAPLGYLVIRSGQFPKVLGGALIVGCAGYLARVCVNVLAPALDVELLGLVGVLPEVAFLGWLLVKGVRTPAGDGLQRAALVP
jgi:hypothetical protein